MSYKSASAKGSPAASVIGLVLIAGFIFYASHNPNHAANGATTAFGKISNKVFSSKSNTTEEISNPLSLPSLSIPHFASSNAPVRVTSRSTLTSGQTYVVLELAPSTGDQFASTYPDAVTPAVDSKGGVK